MAEGLTITPRTKRYLPLPVVAQGKQGALDPEPKRSDLVVRQKHIDEIVETVGDFVEESLEGGIGSGALRSAVAKFRGHHDNLRTSVRRRRRLLQRPARRDAKSPSAAADLLAGALGIRNTSINGPETSPTTEQFLPLSDCVSAKGEPFFIWQNKRQRIPVEMSPAPPDLSLGANLRRLAVFAKDSPGEAIDSASTMRALHPQADAVPVYWCFNRMAEFELLGAAFGAMQPLAGMRSLNQILRVTPDTNFVLDALAAHYADALLARFGTRPCIVGGNCQAAVIAWRVANRLRAAGVTVQRLVFLDAEPHLPWPGTVRLLFGARAVGYNPFLMAPADPLRPIHWHWKRAWHRVETRIVPGGHGEYFRPENLPEVARAILEPESTAAMPETYSAARAACRHLRCTVVHEGPDATTVELVAPEGLSALRGLAVLPLWRRPDGGLQTVPAADWIVPVKTLPVWRHRFPKPPGPAELRLVPVPCMAGYGPLTWPAGE